MTTHPLSPPDGFHHAPCPQHPDQPCLSHTCLRTPFLSRGIAEPQGRRPRPVCRIPPGSPPAGFHLGHTRDTARVATGSDLRVARASGCFCYLPRPPLAIPRRLLPSSLDARSATRPPGPAPNIPKSSSRPSGHSSSCPDYAKAPTWPSHWHRLLLSSLPHTPPPPRPRRASRGTRVSGGPPGP